MENNTCNKVVPIILLLNHLKLTNQTFNNLNVFKSFNQSVFIC